MTDVEAQVAAGMRAQLGRRDAELVAGAESLGWKMGLTVPAVQESLGLSGPVVGYMTTGSRLAPTVSPSLAGFTTAVAEPEVAIHVGDGGAIAGLGAAIELVDIDLPFEDVEAILAGNIFHRAVLLGPPVADATLEGVAAEVTKDGEPIADADAAAVVGDPADTVRFVSEYLEPHGAALTGGEVIIAGSLTPPVPVGPGESFELDLGPLGSLSLSFAE